MEITYIYIWGSVCREILGFNVWGFKCVELGCRVVSGV